MIHADTTTNVLTHEGVRGTFIFQSVGIAALVASSMVALAVLIPVARVGFGALARTGAGRMTALFIGMNCFLLLPTRDPMGDVYASVACMQTAVALILAAFLLEEKWVLAIGAICLLVGIGYHLHCALTVFRSNLWLSLALTGAVVILASSYLERNGTQIRLRLRATRKHLQAWS